MTRPDAAPDQPGTAGTSGTTRPAALARGVHRDPITLTSVQAYVLVDHAGAPIARVAMPTSVARERAEAAAALLLDELDPPTEDGGPGRRQRRNVRLSLPSAAAVLPWLAAACG